MRTEPWELGMSTCRRRDSRLRVVGESITLTITRMSAVLECLMKENTSLVEVKPVRVKSCPALRQLFILKASVILHVLELIDSN